MSILNQDLKHPGFLSNGKPTPCTNRKVWAQLSVLTHSNTRNSSCWGATHIQCPAYANHLRMIHLSGH